MKSHASFFLNLKNQLKIRIQFYEYVKFKNQLEIRITIFDQYVKLLTIYLSHPGICLVRS